MSLKMRPIRETIPLDVARGLILEACAPIDRVERVEISAASGRVIAHDIISTCDVPPFARASMDGYAVVATDTFGASRFEPKTLHVVDKIFTGQVASAIVQSGQAAEIATGAPMPEGADAVVMVEETERSGDGGVQIFAPVYPRQNVGRRGADIVHGQIVLRRGEPLNPSRVGALAALGLTDVDVYARPTVAILSTGNEIAAPGAALAPGQIYDINRFTLGAIVSEHGAVPVPHQTAQDTIDDLNVAIDRCLTSDLIVFSGGSSVGERDLILDVIERRGELVFHGIALKPGKPTAFGVVQGTPVFGMPGYPSSCLSNAYLLLVPALRRVAHLPPHTPHSVTVPLAQRIISTTGRHQFYSVRLVDGVAHPAFKASGDITSMSQADGYIEIPAQTDIVEKGEMVEVKLF
jgi:molybdenum cofactor synthesis domain-containing protein